VHLCFFPGQDVPEQFVNLHASVLPPLSLVRPRPPAPAFLQPYKTRENKIPWGIRAPLFDFTTQQKLNSAVAYKVPRRPQQPPAAVRAVGCARTALPNMDMETSASSNSNHSGQPTSTSTSTEEGARILPSQDPVTKHPLPARSNSTSQSLSSPSSVTASGSGPSSGSSSAALNLNLKGRHAEPNTTEAHAEPASLSMPPPLTIPQGSSTSSLQNLKKQHQQQQQQQQDSRRESSYSEAWSEDANAASILKNSDVFFSSSPRDFAFDPPSAAADSGGDFETPKLQAGASTNDSAAQEGYLPEPALRVGSRSSFSDANASHRVSISSMYSLASARGVVSSSASANGSDNNSTSGVVSPAHRVASGLMASSSGGAKGPATAQPEAGVSSMTVTTASQGAQVGAHHLAPRDSHDLNDMIKKPGGQATQQPPQPQVGAGVGSTGGPPQRAQPTRSRSRAKRRFSGSTAASSHSPSSDRAMVHRERAEKEEVKPAPWGVIGVCALDIKARSKPSRNILNRLIQNREFDVCVFGDKVILDEGSTSWFPPPWR